MGAELAIMGLVTAAGVGTSMFAGMKQSEYTKQGVAASIKAENARERQMNLEAQRKQREIIRSAGLARANSLVNATSQGAQAGSGIAGALAQNESERQYNLNQNQFSLDVGRDIFAANRELARAQGRASTWQGVEKIGNALVANAGTFGKVGATAGANIFNFNSDPWNTASRRYI